MEILLRSYQTCNLVTLNVAAYVNGDLSFNWHLFEKEAALFTRAAYRVTMNELELSHWNQAQEEDRLLGVSPTGYMDAVRKMGIADLGTKEISFLKRMFSIIRSAADDYADELGMNRSLNVTAVKPSGTLSIIAMSSDGVHERHAKRYFRTIRVAKNDAFYQVVQHMDWRVEDDVTKPNDIAVVYFPVESDVDITKYDVSAIEQLERYKLFQRHYTEQNTSITVTVRNLELDNLSDNAKKVYNNIKYGTNTIEALNLLMTDPKSYGYVEGINVEEEVKDLLNVVYEVDVYGIDKIQYTAIKEENGVLSIDDEFDSGEWKDVEEWLNLNWDEFTGVSFLSLSDHQYQQAPYQTIDKETYEKANANMHELDHYILTKYLKINTGGKYEDLNAECATGACASDRI